MFFSFTFMLTFITLIVNIFDMIFMLYATQIGRKEIIETSSHRERFLYVCNFSFYWVNLLFFLFQVFVNKQLLKWQLQQLIKAKKGKKINLKKIETGAINFVAKLQISSAQKTINLNTYYLWNNVKLYCCGMPFRCINISVYHI